MTAIVLGIAGFIVVYLLAGFSLFSSFLLANLSVMAILLIRE